MAAAPDPDREDYAARSIWNRPRGSRGGRNGDSHGRRNGEQFRDFGRIGEWYSHGGQNWGQQSRGSQNGEHYSRDGQNGEQSGQNDEQVGHSDRNGEQDSHGSRIGEQYSFGSENRVRHGRGGRNSVQHSRSIRRGVLRGHGSQNGEQYRRDGQNSEQGSHDIQSSEQDSPSNLNNEQYSHSSLIWKQYSQGGRNADSSQNSEQYSHDGQNSEQNSYASRNSEQDSRNKQHSYGGQFDDQYSHRSLNRVQRGHGRGNAEQHSLGSQNVEQYHHDGQISEQNMHGSRNNEQDSRDEQHSQGSRFGEQYDHGSQNREQHGRGGRIAEQHSVGSRDGKSSEQNSRGGRTTERDSLGEQHSHGGRVGKQYNHRGQNQEQHRHTGQNAEQHGHNSQNSKQYSHDGQNSVQNSRGGRNIKQGNHGEQYSHGGRIREQYRDSGQNWEQHSRVDRNNQQHSRGSQNKEQYSHEGQNSELNSCGGQNSKQDSFNNLNGKQHSHGGQIGEQYSHSGQISKYGRGGAGWNGEQDSHSGRNGEQYRLELALSGDESLDRALHMVLSAFPALFDDLCESCHSIIESRLTNFAEGLSNDSVAESEASSWNTSYDGQRRRASDVTRKLNSSSTNAHTSSFNYIEKTSAGLGAEDLYDESVTIEESYGSSYVYAESSGKGSDTNAWGSTSKILHYPENVKEQYEAQTSWPALGSSNHPKHRIQGHSQHAEHVKHKEELISDVKPAPSSGRNGQHLHESQKTVAPYRDALKKLRISSSSDFTGTTISDSRGSIYPASVWKSHPNKSAPKSSERAILTEVIEERSNGSVITNQDNKDTIEREWMRFQEVVAKKDFEFFEWVDGRKVNILEGLELHTNILNAQEQEKLISFALELQSKGRNKELMGRTYSEPRKWMRGKGRVTIQFGCCYNYASDKSGNPPGIVRDETVDPLPKLLKATIKRLVRWHVLSPSCVPDSCIINIYDEGDCIPPHIDHHDFVRPFCTLSLLSECNIVFGSTLKIIGPGEFEGPVKVPLPIGSVLVLNGNGADVAKHAVPAVPTKRISITFRKMDPVKIPYGFVYEEDLQKLMPL